MCFKQKTAYEMRISDWSSDVCSSDLTRRRTGEAGEEAGDHGLRTAGDDGTRRAVDRLPHLALRAAARAAGDRAFPPDPSPSQAPVAPPDRRHQPRRSEEHTSELQSLMRTSYAVFCLKKKNNKYT